jgi:hypothetical protein
MENVCLIVPCLQDDKTSLESSLRKPASALARKDEDINCNVQTISVYVAVRNPWASESYAFI